MRYKLYLLRQWLKAEEAQLRKLSLIILIIALAFALGYIFASQEQKAPIIIEKIVTDG